MGSDAHSGWMSNGSEYVSSDRGEKPGGLAGGKSEELTDLTKVVV